MAAKRIVPRIWANPLEGLIFVSILLFLIGTINVFSASFVLGSQLLGDSMFFLKRHFAAFVLGIAGCVIIMKIGYKKLLRHSHWLVFLTIGLLIVVYFVGADANGARRWINVFGIIKFQPSELAKLAAILVAAEYIGPLLDRKQASLLSYPIVMTVGMAGLVLFQPDMGTAVIIAGLCFAPYLLVGLPWKQWVFLLATGAVGLVFFIKQFTYRAERVMAWLNPGEYSQTSGYQPIQSLLAIGSGELTGTGLGMGASKFYYLPEAHTDFAFAIWAQETGFVGATVVLFLMVALACYGIRIGLETTDGRGRVLSYAVVMMIVGQAIGNAAMVLGLLPVTGVPMPFFSYGGSALAVNLWTMGFIFSVGISVLKRKNEPTRNDPAEVVPGKPRLKLVERLEKQGR